MFSPTRVRCLDNEAIYFAVPTLASVHKIIEDLIPENSKYSLGHVFFTESWYTSICSASTFDILTCVFKRAPHESLQEAKGKSLDGQDRNAEGAICELHWCVYWTAHLSDTDVKQLLRREFLL